MRLEAGCEGLELHILRRSPLASNKANILN